MNFKITLTFCLGLLFIKSALCQSTVAKKSYYDYYETKIKRSWNELGNGVIHGEEINYDEYGRVAIKRYFDNGRMKKTISLFQTGEIEYEGNFNDAGNPEGEQSWYIIENGKRYLKAEAKIVSDQIIYFKRYYTQDMIMYSYSEHGNSQKFKGYNTGGELFIDITYLNGNLFGFAKGSKVSCKFISSELQEYGGNDIVASRTGNLLNAQIQSKEGTWSQNMKPKQTKYRLYRDLNSTFALNEPLQLTLELKVQYEALLKFTESKFNFKDSYSSLCNILWNNTYRVDTAELKSDNGSIQKKWIFSETGVYLKEIVYFENGSIKQVTENHPDRMVEKLFFSSDGKLIKRSTQENQRGYTEANFTYDESGSIVNDNQVIRELQQLSADYNYFYDLFTELNNDINNTVGDQFCIDYKTGDFLNNCYPSPLQQSVRILYTNVDRSFQNISKHPGQVLDSLVSNEINWDDPYSDTLEKIYYFSNRILLFKKLHSLNYDFNQALSKCVEIKGNQDQLDKYNERLIDIEEPAEIKQIIFSNL